MDGVVEAKIKDKMIKNKKSKRKIRDRTFLSYFSLLIFVFFFYIFNFAFAGVIDVRAPEKINVNDEFRVFVFIDTENEEINAVEGKIIFSADLLELKDILEANSIISLWIERPRLIQDGVVIFSGIIPGGYKGKEGLLLTLVFKSRIVETKPSLFEAEKANISLKDFRILLNDGKGTETKTKVKEAKILIEKTEKEPISVSQIDVLPPEAFKPEIGQDPNLFNGKYFLVFQAQDKQSGVASYEVKEVRYKIFSFLKKWEFAESPYLLKDQKLRSYIFVKAIDKAGNERIEFIPPQNPLRWYERIDIGIIIIVIGLGVVIIRYLWSVFRFSFPFKQNARKN